MSREAGHNFASSGKAARACDRQLAAAFRTCRDVRAFAQTLRHAPSLYITRIPHLTTPHRTAPHNSPPHHEPAFSVPFICHIHKLTCR
jgi:hypothetical protein